MTFPTSIQALIGAHTAQSAGYIQCAVDWSRKNVYITSTVSAVNYLSSVGLLTGIEQVFALRSFYTVPMFGSVVPNPIGVDANGRPYLCWEGLNGGGLVQINGTTLAQLAAGGNTSDPPGGFQISNGALSCPANGSTQFMLGTSIGGNLTGTRSLVVWNETTFAGRYQTFGGALVDSIAVNCAGLPGTGTGYVAAGPEGPSDAQTLFVSVVQANPGGGWVIGDWPTQNSSVTVTALVTLIPTDINGSWTQIYAHGICVDQTDGNILLWVRSQNSANSAIVKLNAVTGAIIWNRPITNGGSAVNRQFSFSNITHQRLAVLTTSPNTLSVIDTSDGSVTSYTTDLAGLVLYGPQSYNDSLGGVLCVVGRTLDPGGPTSLNSTPDDFTGWAMLYVQPANQIATGTTGSYTRIWGNWHV